MKYDERAVPFTCCNQSLLGIVATPAPPASRGVLVVVGGPQYRAGSHRQFTLLSRDLASDGFPVFRFDYGGMGDSEGTAKTFEEVNDDIRAALDAFVQSVPSISEVVIWGLCDGASAASLYAHEDSRVRGLVLLNPWVRTEQGMAKTFLKRYYIRRLFAPEFWIKILSGRFDYRAAARSLLANIRKLAGSAHAVTSQTEPGNIAPSPSPALPDRVLNGLSRFQGHVLFILSGNDLTAQEFEETAISNARWRKFMSAANVRMQKLTGADHTFSRREWRDQVSEWTKEWLRAW